MTRGVTFLFAVAGGAAVGNLCRAQPLLNLIADDLHATPAAAGWLITTTQLGYAAGILLIVALGDVLDRRASSPPARRAPARPRALPAGHFPMASPSMLTWQSWETTARPVCGYDARDAGMGMRVAGQEFSGRELARTAAAMRSTAEQLRRAAARVHASAAAARSERTAARLRALGDAVLVQADAITQRAGRLAPAVENDAETPLPANDDERPLP